MRRTSDEEGRIRQIIQFEEIVAILLDKHSIQPYILNPLLQKTDQRMVPNSLPHALPQLPKTRLDLLHLNQNIYTAFSLGLAICDIKILIRYKIKCQITPPHRIYQQLVYIHQKTIFGVVAGALFLCAAGGNPKNRRIFSSKPPRICIFFISIQLFFGPFWPYFPQKYYPPSAQQFWPPFV